MPTLKNRNLDAVGINTDLHPSELPLNGMTDGLNIRFTAGAVHTRDADAPTMTGNDSETYGAPLALIEQSGIWYYGTPDKLWSFEVDNVHHERSRIVPQDVYTDCILGAHTVGDFLDGVDWATLTATFESGGTYEGVVGTGLIVEGYEFSEAGTGHTMIIDTLVGDGNSFTFITSAPDETTFRAVFANPNIFRSVTDVIDGHDTYNTTGYWTMAPFGSTMVATNLSNIPQIKIPFQAGQEETLHFINMPQWGVEYITTPPDPEDTNPLNWSTKVIRSYNSFLVAIGMENEDAGEIHAGGRYPQRIRWSSAALPGQAPHSWNGATLETNAGWNDLSGVTGELVDGIPYQDSLILFTENEVVQMQFVGGQDIFTFRNLFNDGGLLARNCAVEFKGQQFCVGPNDVYVHDTSSKRSIATDQVKDRLFAEIGATDSTNVTVHHEEVKEEIWILYSDAVPGSFEYPLNKAAVWNYDKNVWSFFSFSAMSAIASGIRPSANLDAAVSWDDLEDLGDPDWDAVKLPWSGREVGFGNVATVYSSYDGGFYLADYLPEPEEGGHVERYVERVGLDLSQVAQGDIDQWVQLDRILPVVTAGADGTIKLIVTGSEHQHDAPDWEDPTREEIILSASDYKVDIRQSWSYLAIRIEFLDDVPYQLHATDFQVSARGRR